jgi:hypothetical protein
MIVAKKPQNIVNPVNIATSAFLTSGIFAMKAISNVRMLQPLLEREFNSLIHSTSQEDQALPT